jgi:glycine oxidase
MRERIDVVIVGGGVMGCASAWRLAREGARVVVLERSVPGAEASSAAAGILGAQAEAHAPGPMFELSLKSRAMYPRWAKALFEETGMDVGHRASGLLRVAFESRAGDRLFAETSWQRRRRLAVQRVSGPALRRMEPALSAKLTGGVAFPGDGRVDPPLLLRALHVAAQSAGAQFRTGAYVKSVDVRKDRATGVLLDDGSRIGAGHVVVAAGSWTTLVGGLPLAASAVRPARGQIVELFTPAPVLRRVVYGPRCYLVPRDDGRLLVGSTLEFVGYRRDVTAVAVRDLLNAALKLVPALADASLRGTWSSFRPYTDDELPLLGATGVRGLTLATGHYRNGILLAPITAEIVASIVAGRRSPLPLAPFSPLRGRGMGGA